MEWWEDWRDGGMECSIRLARSFEGQVERSAIRKIAELLFWRVTVEVRDVGPASA